MIERLPEQINTQIGEFRGVSFDIIPVATIAMFGRKINEIVDFINRNNKVADLGGLCINQDPLENPPEIITNTETTVWQGLVDKLQAQNSALVNYLMDFMHREQEYAEKYMKGKSKATIKSYHHKIKKHLDSLGIND